MAMVDDDDPPKGPKTASIGDAPCGWCDNLRTRRDAELDLPLLMVPSIQINIRAGTLPPPEQNGVRYLKVPIDLL